MRIVRAGDVKIAAANLSRSLPPHETFAGFAIATTIDTPILNER